MSSPFEITMYGDFEMTDAIRPDKCGIIPTEGYLIQEYSDPFSTVLCASVTRSKLFDCFMAFVEEYLPETVDVVLETSHTSAQHSTHEDLIREAIDNAIVRSHAYDFEDLLMNDGCTGIAMRSRTHPREVQFDQNKLLAVFGTDLQVIEEILLRHDVKRDQYMQFISQGPLLHSTEPEHKEQFEDLAWKLGVRETDSIYDEPGADDGDDGEMSWN